MFAFKLTPPLKDLIWGGHRLSREFSKAGDKIAESWELACREDGMSIAETQEFGSIALCDLIERVSKRELLGPAAERFADFPVLIKLIDAEADLSVQVHPDDEYAHAHGADSGKTEMWYVVDADEGASLLCGFNREITKEELIAAADDGSIMDLLCRIPVSSGDVFFIPSKTVHAIGKGILIAEIQQNSNTTYRVYDYKRLGADGKPRPLHIEDAANVADLCPAKKSESFTAERIGGITRLPLARHEFFKVDRLTLAGEGEITLSDSFMHLLVLSGELTLTKGGESLTAKKGESVFVPYSLSGFTLNGEADVIATTV